VIARNFCVHQLEQAVESTLYCSIDGAGSTMKNVFRKVDDIKTMQAESLLKEFNLFADVTTGLNFNNLTCAPDTQIVPRE